MFQQLAWNTKAQEVRIRYLNTMELIPRWTRFWGSSRKPGKDEHSQRLNCCFTLGYWVLAPLFDSVAPTHIRWGSPFVCVKIKLIKKRTHSSLPRPQKSKANDTQKPNWVAGISVEYQTHKSQNQSWNSTFSYSTSFFFVFFSFIFIIFFSDYWSNTCSGERIQT